LVAGDVDLPSRGQVHANVGKKVGGALSEVSRYSR
jgi:hypothetical protein